MEIRLAKKYAVYVDWTTEEVPRAFYVGKGMLKRVQGLRRNRRHHMLSERYGIRREIVEWFDNEDGALTRETELIVEHKTHYYTWKWGANFKLRDTGKNGVTQSDESNAKRSQALKGRKPHAFSAETRKKMSEAAKKRGAHPAALEGIRQARKGKHLSESHRQHLRETMATSEYKEHLSASVRKAYEDPKLRKRVGELAVKGKLAKRAAQAETAALSEASTGETSAVNT